VKAIEERKITKVSLSWTGDLTTRGAVSNDDVVMSNPRPSIGSTAFISVAMS
jgi:hypothetical protein